MLSTLQLDESNARVFLRGAFLLRRTWGEHSDQLHERHDAGDFETRTQDKVGDSRTASGG